LRLPENGQEHSHIAQGDCLNNGPVDDPHIAAVINQAGKHAPSQTCQRALASDRHVLLEETDKERLEALEQGFPQTKKLDFLEGIITRQEHFQVG